MPKMIQSSKVGEPKKGTGVRRPASPPELDPATLDRLFAEGNELRLRLHQKHKAARSVTERSLRFIVR